MLLHPAEPLHPTHANPSSTWILHTQRRPGFNTEVTSSMKPPLLLPSVSPQCPPQTWTTNSWLLRAQVPKFGGTTILCADLFIKQTRISGSKSFLERSEENRAICQVQSTHVVHQLAFVYLLAYGSASSTGGRAFLREGLL